jgi:hypothetical protein
MNSYARGVRFEYPRRKYPERNIQVCVAACQLGQPAIEGTLPMGALITKVYVDGRTNSGDALVAWAESAWSTP